MSFQITLAVTFLAGFGIGWALCSLGVSVKLSDEEKMRLIREWRIELEEKQRMMQRNAENARRRARE